jgi:xylulokinase
MNVTNTTEIVKALFGLTNRKLEAVAAMAAPGAGGLLFLPFIDGERVPVLPYASAVFFGLNRKTFSRPHLARAVMEGTMLNLGYGFARMRELGLKPDEIRATGGGSKSRLWLQIAADVLQTPVVTLKEKEAAAFGGALQSIWSYLLEKGEKAAIRNIAKARVALDKLAAEPDPRNRGTYEALQERFNSLWRTLEPEFRAQKQASSRL